MSRCDDSTWLGLRTYYQFTAGAGIPSRARVRGMPRKTSPGLLLPLAPMTLMLAPPGTGKTMLAKRLPTVLTSLSSRRSLGTARPSLAGQGLPSVPSGWPFVSLGPISPGAHHLLGGGALPPAPGYPVSTRQMRSLVVRDGPEWSSRAFRKPREIRIYGVSSL